MIRLSLVLLICAATAIAQSPYAGQQGRALKMLSTEDIAEIEAGAGWGLAKVAELNGIPGPVHLLELKQDIPLSADQVSRLEVIYAEMKAEAIAAGAKYIAAEAALETAFASGEIDATRLALLLDKVATTRRDLQFVHLSRHLDTPALLRPGRSRATTACAATEAIPARPHRRATTPKGGDVTTAATSLLP